MKIFLGILSIFTLIYFQPTTATEKAGTETLIAEAETTEKRVEPAACEQQASRRETSNFTAILECDCKVKTKTERSASPHWKKTVKGVGITKDEQIVEAINDAIAKCDKIKEDAPDLYRSSKLTSCREIELLPDSEESE